MNSKATSPQRRLHSPVRVRIGNISPMSDVSGAMCPNSIAFDDPFSLADHDLPAEQIDSSAGVDAKLALGARK